MINVRTAKQGMATAKAIAAMLLLAIGARAAGLPTEIWTCASWSSDEAKPMFPYAVRAFSDAFSAPLPLASWSSSDDAGTWYLDLVGTNISRVIPAEEWFDRAYAVEMLVRLTSMTNSLFAGTLASATGEDRRGFFVTVNEQGEARGSIHAGLQRGPGHTLAAVQTPNGIVVEGQWNHLLFVKSPRHVRLWVNGTLVATHKMVMQYSYVYPQKDFSPRVFRLDGTADIGFVRLYDGWLHEPEAEALYATARSTHAGFNLPAAPRTYRRLWSATVALLLLAGIVGGVWAVRRFWPGDEVFATQPLVARLQQMAEAMAVRPLIAQGTFRARQVLLPLLVLVVAGHEWVKFEQPTYEYRNEVLWGDYMNTDVAARDLAAGFGFRELRLQESTLPRNPLHAVHLAVLYTMFGGEGQAQNLHRVAGSVAIILTCVVLFEMLLGLFGPLAAFLGVLLFHNAFGIASQQILSETTAVLLLALFLHMTILSVRRQSLKAAMLAGFFGGASVLVRSYFGIVWLPAALWFGWRALWDGGRRRFWLHAVLQFTLLFLAPPMLYGMRNFFAIGQFTTTSTYQTVDPWGQHCGDTPIDFHAWQLFKWPDDATAQRMMRHELGCHVRDFPGEFLATWRAGIGWICRDTMPRSLTLLLPVALPVLVVYLLACIAGRRGVQQRVHAEAVCFAVCALALIPVILSAGHPSGFPETVPRYWIPVKLCVGALAAALVCWLPCMGWAGAPTSERRDRVSFLTIAAGTAAYLVVLAICAVVWSLRAHAVEFPMAREFDWRGFARTVLANEGKLVSNVAATATGTLSYPTRTSYGLQADLLVRNREYPSGEIRVRVKMAQEFVPLAGLDPETVWGRNVQLAGRVVPDDSNHVFEAVCFEVDRMALLDETFITGITATRSPRPEATAAGATATYIMDMQPLAMTGMLRGMVLGSTYDKQPVVIGGAYYPRSIAMHPMPEGPCYVDYALDGKYSSFKSLVWVTSIGNAKFMVYGDGTLLYETPYIQPTNLHICPLPQTNLPMLINVDVRGYKTLRLGIDKGFHHYSDHTVWGDPQVEP